MTTCDLCCSSSSSNNNSNTNSNDNSNNNSNNGDQIELISENENPFNFSQLKLDDIMRNPHNWQAQHLLKKILDKSSYCKCLDYNLQNGIEFGELYDAQYWDDIEQKMAMKDVKKDVNYNSYRQRREAATFYRSIRDNTRSSLITPSQFLIWYIGCSKYDDDKIQDILCMSSDIERMCKVAPAVDCDKLKHICTKFPDAHFIYSSQYNEEIFCYNTKNHMELQELDGNKLSISIMALNNYCEKNEIECVMVYMNGHGENGYFNLSKKDKTLVIFLNIYIL